MDKSFYHASHKVIHRQGRSKFLRNSSLQDRWFIFSHQPPSYKWFKEIDDQLLPLTLNDRIYVISDGLLKISKIKLEDTGKFLCWVNNSAGEETIQITLTVTASLSVHLQPQVSFLRVLVSFLINPIISQVQTVDVDKNAEFQCIISGSPVDKVIWMHDGKPLINDNRVEIHSDPHRLVLKKIQKEDHGMYQCFVSNEWEQVQSTAELQLGDASPELLYWFSEQTLQPGPTVSLKCVATGHPPPQFVWKLDGFPVSPKEITLILLCNILPHQSLDSGKLKVSNWTICNGSRWCHFSR